jgi:hypothetical protein
VLALRGTVRDQQVVKRGRWLLDGPRLVDVETGQFLDLDDDALALLAEGVPAAGGGPTAGGADATDPEDGQLLLSEVVDATPPPPPRRAKR